MAKKRQVGRPTKYRPEMCDTIIEMMRDGAAKVEVCAAIGITQETMRVWAADPKKPEFSEALKVGLELSEAWWCSRGRLNLENREFNATLWYMNMKNRHGWRDKHEHSGNDAAPIRIATTPFDDGI